MFGDGFGEPALGFFPGEKGVSLVGWLVGFVGVFSLILILGLVWFSFVFLACFGCVMTVFQFTAFTSYVD